MAVPSAGGLPETAAVHWRPRVDAASLARLERAWTLTTLAATVPFVLAATLLVLAKPVLAPISLLLLAHAWAIPELYANRGAKVLRTWAPAASGPESRALSLLGDLVGHQARELHGRTGLVVEPPGRLGRWVVGEGGALLVRDGGRFGRIDCYCVRVTGDELPSSDRIAHLLLALREDEVGFATVANLAFSGAAWRVIRRLPERQREAVRAAAA